MTDQNLLTLRDIAERTRCSRWAVYRWRRRYTDFPIPLLLGSGTRPLFFEHEFEAWLLTRRNHGGRR